MKIILSVIVGNEAPVIERFIRSFAPAVDEFVFIRAIGNQEADKTEEIASKTLKEIDKKGSFGDYVNTAEMPHVDDFSRARQGALNGAECKSEKGDYIMWADADDVLADGAAEVIREAARCGEHDVFLMPYNVRGDKQVIWRERLVKAGIGAEWQYAIHEQMKFKRDVSYRMLKDATFIHSPLEDKPASHGRNLTILQNELKDTPHNLFYLAQEYFQSGKINEFKPVAQAALTLGGLAQIERYEILMQLAQAHGTESKKLAAEAFALMPDRREALALLINYAIIDGEHERALILAETMMQLGLPKRTYWSLNHEWYGWKGDELYRQCLRLNGSRQEADNDWLGSTDDFWPKITIIHKTSGQPEKSLAVRETWYSFAKHPENIDYVFQISPDDTRSLNTLKGFRYTTEEGVSKLGEYTMSADDDTFPEQLWDSKPPAKKEERSLVAV